MINKSNTKASAVTILQNLGDKSYEELMELLAAQNFKSLEERTLEAINTRDADDEIEDKEIKKVLKNAARRIIPGWKVEPVRGEHRGKGQKVMGVRITSKMFDQESRIYTLDYLYEKPTAVQQDLKDIGAFRPSDYGILVEYIRLLIAEQKVTQVDSLADQLNNCLPFDKAKEQFAFMKRKVLERLDFFPRLSQIPHDITYGIRLDMGDYIQRLGLVINKDHPELEDSVGFAITTDFLCTIFEISSYKTARFKALIRSWYEYGFLAPVEHYDISHLGEPIFTGSARVTKYFYVFKFDNMIAETAKVKESMRYTKHVE